MLFARAKLSATHLWASSLAVLPDSSRTDVQPPASFVLPKTGIQLGAVGRFTKGIRLSNNILVKKREKEKQRVYV